MSTDVLTLHELGNLIQLRAQLDAHPALHFQQMWFRVVDIDAEQAQSMSVLAVLDARPTTWTCATAACAAGWACILAGDKPIGESAVETAGTGTWDVAANRAQRLLGLDDDEARWLFAGDNTRREVLDILDRLIASRDAGWRTAHR